MKLACLHLASILLLASIAPVRVSAQETEVPKAAEASKVKKAEPQKPDWQKIGKLRFVDLLRSKKDEPRALRTSVVRFVPWGEKSPIEHLDLVAAVHIGDAGYFESLNRLFDDYDVVLFEMANETDPRQNMKRETPSFMKMFQMNPATMLGLEHQLDLINYDRRHFVHADTSIQAAMKKRGEDWLSLGLSVFMDIMRQTKNSEKGGLDLLGGEELDALSLFGMGSSDPLKLKRTFAEQLADPELDGLPGFTTLNELLIVERNKVAMTQLDRQIKLGKKKIAIYYGAAHMPDFARRLVFEQQLRPARMAWLNAWDLSGKKPAKRRSSNPIEQALGGAMDRNSAHDFIDQLFDMIDQMMRSDDR